MNVEEAPIKSATLNAGTNKLYRNSNADPTLKFNLSLAIGTNLNDSDVSMRYGINSYESGDTVYSGLSTLLQDTLLSASEILEKVGDSDVAEIYYTVTTGDGYEITSSTLRIDLVDCEHSHVVDPTTDEETGGNIEKPTYCEICKNQFYAKIVNGDSVKYYNDLYEAVADAQKSENEGCTLYPLYDENGYKEQIVISGGKFTFRLLARVYLSKPVIIKGDADITISGRTLVTNVADKTAVIVEGGNVDFTGLATDDVSINGGNVTMTGNNIKRFTIKGGNLGIGGGQFAQIDVNAEGKVIADYIVPGNWVQDGNTNEWIDIYHLTSAAETAEYVGLRVRMCPMLITQTEDTVYYTNGYYPNGIPSLEVDAMAQYTAEVNPAIAYQWFSVDENGNETEIEGATGKTLSLENLTTGKYYCRLTYSNATTAGVSMKSDVVTATITECEHSGGEATCTEKAKCEICGAEYGEMLPHSYANIKSSEYLNSAATCTEKAVYYTSCADCGLSSKGTKNEATFEYGNALGHKYSAWVSNGDGTHTRVCANDNKHTETADCHGGTATCTTKAVYYTSCTDCGLSSKGTKNEVTFEYGNALGHKYSAWVSNGNGTHTRVCANDNKHTETKECHGGTATCTAKAKCADCGAEYGEMTAHTFTAKTATAKYLKTAATCTAKAAYYTSCADCGLSSKGTASEAVFSGSALGHSLTAWAVTAAATCTADGSQERHCTRCDYQQTKTIAAKGHKFGAWAITKNVSCLEDGEQSRVCSVCKKKEVKTIAATGVYIFSAWKVTKAATCTTAGAKERTCTGCGAKETVVIQATGHKYVESIVKPTYTEKGYTLHKCSVCGNSYKSAYTDKLVLATVTGATLGGRAADALRINWNKNASADGYIVEIYKDGEWSRAGKITNNSTVTFRAEGLKASTVYKLRVRAYKMSGTVAHYGNYSAEITARTNPSVMTGVKAGGTAKDALRVNWNKNTSAQGYIVEMYKDGKWVRAAKITDNSTTTFRKAGLAKNTSYRFRVCAYYMSGSTPLYGTYVSVIGKTAAD